MTVARSCQTFIVRAIELYYGGNCILYLPSLSVQQEANVKLRNHACLPRIKILLISSAASNGEDK